jgi:hypothetical protein
MSSLNIYLFILFILYFYLPFIKIIIRITICDENPIINDPSPHYRCYDTLLKDVRSF